MIMMTNRIASLQQMLQFWYPDGTQFFRGCYSRIAWMFYGGFVKFVSFRFVLKAAKGSLQRILITSLEKIMYKQAFSIPVIIIASHLCLGHIYFFKKDSEQHESFGNFNLVAVQISTILYIIFTFHYLITYWFCKPSHTVSTWIVRKKLKLKVN